MRGRFRGRLQETLIKYMSQYLKRLRKDLGMTQDKMAEALHLDTRSYQIYESGDGLCGLVTFIILFHDLCPHKRQLLKDLYEIIIEVWTNEAA